MTGAPDGAGRTWVWNVAVVWFAAFVAMAGMSLAIPFLPLYLTELQVPPDRLRLWAGWIGGVNFLFAAMLAPFWGGLADRHGRKLMAMRALLGLAVTVALMAYARNAWDLLILRILQGALGGFVAEAIALVSVSVPRDRLGACLGLVQAGVVSGNFIGPLIGGELSTRFGYRQTFLITGVALLCALLLIYLLVHERQRDAAAGDARPTLRESIRELLTLPQLKWMMLVVVFSHSGQMLLNPQLSLFVRDLVGPGGDVNRLAGIVTAAPALTSVVMSTVWGRLGDKRGHAAVLAIALTAAGCIVPWGALSTSWVHLVLLRLGMGAFSSALNPSAHSAVAHRVPEEKLAGAYSLLASAQMLGACAGPLLSGYVATAFGVRPLFLLTSLLLFCGAGCAAWVNRAHPTPAAPR